MQLQTITPAAGMPVTLDELKLHARVDSPHENNLLTDLIAVATEYLDGKSGLLGRSLITQTYRLTLDAFPAEIALPLPPAQAVTSITYIDAEGAVQTLDPSAYRLIGSDPGKVIPVNSWPSTKTDPEAVKIEFRAGYGDLAADVPAAIKRAILEHCTFFYETRSMISFASAPSIVPMGYDALIEPYRIRGFG